ncbi:MAG: MATE family efflux transporter [Defluviitaleaceae bacterium]|nr:MATE family efflux transporter [Defluviitaleaceae bacterium]MCL2262904.1 MATE family efflux transporter [Defluviitaleaceae bacterium]
MEQTVDPQLDKKITPWFLFSFSVPTIISMVVVGVSGLVDGIFAARFIDAYALSAVGLVSPFIMFAMSIGFMLGIGGNALVAKEVGEGRVEHARKDLSLLTIASFLAIVAVTIIGFIIPDTILWILGVDSYVHEIALGYMMPLLPFLPLGGLGIVLQQFLITEGKAHYGMIASILQGLASAALNYVFIYQMHMGIRGAAIATGIGFTIPAFVGVAFFIFNRFNKRGILYFVVPKFKAFVIARSSINGVSEMIGMMSAAITQLTVNNVLMDLDGPMAVAAAGIILAGSGLALNVFIGFVSGISPIISYNYGKGDDGNIKKLFSYSIVIIVCLALGMTALAFGFIDFFIQLYDIDPFIYVGTFLLSLPVYDMSFTGLRVVAVTFAIASVNIFASTFFTAFGDGIKSGFIAVCNGLVFIIGFTFLFANRWGVDGVWIAMPARDILTLGVAVFLLWKYRKVYKYA